jgi:hypothetical protein
VVDEIVTKVRSIHLLVVVLTAYSSRGESIDSTRTRPIEKEGGGDKPLPVLGKRGVGVRYSRKVSSNPT